MILFRIKNRLNHYAQVFRGFLFTGLSGYSAKIKIDHGVRLGGKLKLGKYVTVMRYSEIRGTVTIEPNVFIHENVLIRSFAGAIIVGENTTINRNTVLLGLITIGRGCSIAPNVIIVGSNHNYNITAPIKSQGESMKGIVIEDDVWIAANVSILDGVHIGQGAVIGAGAVVTKDVLSNSVVGGVPAKLLKMR